MSENRRRTLILKMFERNVISIFENPKILTSGQFSNYYCNTERLDGGIEGANETLGLIVENMDKHTLELPRIVYEKLNDDYQKDPVYRGIIGMLHEDIQGNPELKNIGLVSGGLKRDIFYSILIARALEKPHLTILKEGKGVILSEPDGRQAHYIDEFKDNEKVLHVTDIVTMAFSHLKKWGPALQKINATMVENYAVVDRKQGADVAFKKMGVNSHSLISTDIDFFRDAVMLGKLTGQEYSMVSPYVTNPIGTMNTFMKEHPEYIYQMIESGDLEICRRFEDCFANGYYSEMPKDAPGRVLERIMNLKGTK